MAQSVFEISSSKSSPKSREHLNRPMRQMAVLRLALSFALCMAVGCTSSRTSPGDFHRFVLDYQTSPDPGLQGRLERLDTELRQRLGIKAEETAAGVLDLNTLRLATVHPDLEFYGASVPKIGILLAYFELHPEAATNLAAETRHELGLMIKASDNQMAAKFSRELSLKQIQAVLDRYGFYDAQRGGGIWVGKHYGQGTERYGDPVADNSHAATVRQLLRYYLLLEQGKLVSPAASNSMREIFASPDIPHERNKFLLALAASDSDVIRKSGTWEDWLHDSAVVSGQGRHYIVVGLTHHPRGDEYLAALAKEVDGWIRDCKP
jgi:beta-lactamase class A